MKLLYEGKAKKLYETESPNELRMEFKDDATAFNGEKLEQFPGKGKLNKQLTLLLYGLLRKQGVATHFVRDEDEITMIVRAVKIVPLEVVVRNIAAGSLARRTGLAEGTPLAHPIVEYYYKSDELGDPLLTEDHIAVLDLAAPDELEALRTEALKINDILRPFFAKAGITLVDFKIEFGRDPEGFLLLADEITPDTCRLWDAESGKKLDKDVFRRDLGNLLDGYRDVLQRVDHALHN